MTELFAIGFQEGSGTTAADSSGNGRTFTAVGTAPWNATGKNNACIAPTSGNYFQRTAGIGTGTITTFSALLWFYRTGTPGTWGQFMYDGSGAGFWFEIASDGRVDLNGDVFSPSALPMNTWTHLAVTCAAGALTLYVDGVSVATGTWAGGSSVLLNSAWNIGLGPDGPATGRIDEARFHNTALTGAEIVTLMNTPIGPGATDVPGATARIGLASRAATPAVGVAVDASTARLSLAARPGDPIFGAAVTVPGETARLHMTARAGVVTTPSVTITGATACVAAAARPGTPIVATDYPFVTTIDASGRFFRDQHGAPILIKGDSPWSAFVDLSTSEWETWCANRESHGFNAASVSLLGNPENGGPNANGATFDGIQPFTGTFTPNPTYWARIDAFVQTAADHGITLFLYASDGWVVNIGLSGVISSMNATQAQAYGAFVATRYASAVNVLWMSGGDFFPGVGSDETISQNVLTGIRSVDTVRPHTMQAMYQRSASRQWSTWSGKVQWDFIYSRYPGYELMRKSFARTPAMPAVFGEGIYDGMYSGTTAQSELASRMQIGWALTSGAAGDFYGTEDWQFGSGWAGRLDRNSAVQADNMRAAVEAVDWWKLEPAPSFITSGAGTAYVFPNEPAPGSDPGFPNLVDSGAPSGAGGTIHTHTYATAAVSQDGSVAVVYLPTQRAITIDTSELGTSPTGSWVNPTTGASTTANLASLTPPSSGDWLLIIEAVPVDVTVPGGTGRLGVVGRAAAVSAGVVVTGGTARVSLTAPAAGVASGVVVPGDTAAVSMTARPGDVSTVASVTVAGETARIGLVAREGTITAGVTVQGDTARVSVTGRPGDVSVVPTVTVLGATAKMNVTGRTPLLTVGTTIPGGSARASVAAHAGIVATVEYPPVPTVRTLTGGTRRTLTGGIRHTLTQRSTDD